MALARSRVRLTTEPPMTHEENLALADAVIDDLDAIARDTCNYNFGLPIHNDERVRRMRVAVLTRMREFLRKVTGIAELKAAN